MSCSPTAARRTRCQSVRRSWRGGSRPPAGRRCWCRSSSGSPPSIRRRLARPARGCSTGLRSGRNRLASCGPPGRHHAVVNRRAAGIRPRHGQGQRGRRHEARREHHETSPEGVCRRPMAGDTCGSWVLHLPPPGASLPEAIAITFWNTACAFLLPLNSAGTSDSLVAGTRSSPTISKAPYSSATR